MLPPPPPDGEKEVNVTLAGEEQLEGRSTRGAEKGSGKGRWQVSLKIVTQWVKDTDK